MLTFKLSCVVLFLKYSHVVFEHLEVNDFIIERGLNKCDSLVWHLN